MTANRDLLPEQQGYAPLFPFSSTPPAPAA